MGNKAKNKKLLKLFAEYLNENSETIIIKNATTNIYNLNLL